MAVNEYNLREGDMGFHTNIPLRATIVKHQFKDLYTIHFEKYGTKHKGFSVDLLPEQVERIQWWY